MRECRWSRSATCQRLASMCLSVSVTTVPVSTNAPTTVLMLLSITPRQVTAAEETNVPLVDLTDWICGPELCPAVVNDLLVWRDTHHLTATYARYLAPVIAYGLEDYLVGDTSLFASLAN